MCPVRNDFHDSRNKRAWKLNSGALEEMLSADIQFVLLGSGSPIFERGYQELAKRFPNKVAVRVGYDESLAHRIEVEAADFYLMPSHLSSRVV